MPETLSEDIQLLHTEFLKDAKVIDATKGYISVSSFNLRMKPAVLAAAARVVAEHFAQEKIDAVHGIPHSGNFFATAVAQVLPGEVRLHASRKDQYIPTAWKDIYRKEVQSFTGSLGGADLISGITLSFAKKGDRVLIVDDVCASGNTGYNIIKGLLEKGVRVVGYAVLFDKKFQGGLERIQSLGVDVCSCVRVKKIDQNDRVVLEK